MDAAIETQVMAEDDEVMKDYIDELVDSIGLQNLTDNEFL